MSGDTVVTIIGNLTEAPELRFTPSGAAVANFTVASTPRQFDKASGDFKDGETLFMRCNLWRQPAENLANSDTITRGSRVIVTGRLRQRSFEHDGQKRTVVELEVDEVGPSLRFATAVVNKASGGGGGGERPSSSSGSHSSGSRSGGGNEDQWGSAPAKSSAPVDDEPPF